jgi:chorismate mutase/prephenate dehydratase
MAHPAGDASHAAPRPLAVLRGLIDAVDSNIVEALNERCRLVMEVGRRKAADGTPVYAPHREQAVLSRVLALNKGPMLNVTLEAIYRELMSGSFALERPLRIGASCNKLQGQSATKATFCHFAGYLGPAGSFSHEAAVKQFGSSVSYENLRTIGGGKCGKRYTSCASRPLVARSVRRGCTRPRRLRARTRGKHNTGQRGRDAGLFCGVR